MMDSINKAFILELSYQLTVIVNMTECKLEDGSWMATWHKGAFACAQSWNEYLLSTSANRDTAGFMLVQIVHEIAAVLSPGYVGLVRRAFSQDLQAIYGHIYGTLLQEAHKIAHAPVFAEWGLSEFFVLGQQLAQNDLRAHIVAINKPELQVIVSSSPPFEPLSEKSFPRSWPEWPIDPLFNNCLIRYVENRQKITRSGPFTIGPLMHLILSILAPSRYPSTVWCWQDWDKDESWNLFIAGGIIRAPALATVKDPNDKAFVVLLEAMDGHKKAGRVSEECGWMPRNELWPEMKPNTRSKAWSKLSKETLHLLGNFEFKGKGGKYKDSSSPCRAPAALAKPECKIFIEKWK